MSWCGLISVVATLTACPEGHPRRRIVIATWKLGHGPLEAVVGNIARLDGGWTTKQQL